MRANRREQDESQEVNLVPIMNLVLILIPLLLLSIVFLEVAVIEVQMTQPTMQRTGEPPEPQERLRLYVTLEGFSISRGHYALPPIPGCEHTQVTICTSDTGAPSPIAKYRWHTLYNTMMQLKADPAFANTQDLEVVAASELPFDILVKTMDVLRYQLSLEGQEQAALTLDATELAKAQPFYEETAEGRAPQALFPAVHLGLPVPE